MESSYSLINETALCPLDFIVYCRIKHKITFTPLSRASLMPGQCPYGYISQNTGKDRPRPDNNFVIFTPNEKLYLPHPDS